ncbi:hypothetical protein J4573_09240 [Actinomadura barringtoniae]|uniref:Uncharacterized protein n=1 Tax=Actinomadura barringtoniae TaxID=1427535 RepID=A0A939P7L2_9ACTN|nr:hypothetical protein [Actinomadura barringtoniae]MBO2447267.1 hypothetical protein [Actinomadura barringtoniae]
MSLDWVKAYKEQMFRSGIVIRSVAQEYKGTMADGGLDRPDTGGIESDSALETLLQMIGLLHSAVADATWSHGEKLILAAERIRVAETDATVITQAAIVQDVMATLPNWADNWDNGTLTPKN